MWEYDGEIQSQGEDTGGGYICKWKRKSVAEESYCNKQETCREHAGQKMFLLLPKSTEYFKILSTAIENVLKQIRNRCFGRLVQSQPDIGIKAQTW